MATTHPICDREAAFLDVYSTLNNDFEALGIRHTVLGSLGHTAYIGYELDYDRPSRDLASQIPDIDLLVPRDELRGAREYREKLAKRGVFPVKLGLSLPSYIIDWRPDEDISSLNSKRDTPVRSELLSSVAVNYLGREIQTLDPLVLAETYGIFAGRTRPKDRSKADALRKFGANNGASHFKPEDVKPFAIHRQLEKRHARNRIIEVINRANSHLPDPVRMGVKPAVRAVVNRAGWR